MHTRLRICRSPRRTVGRLAITIAGLCRCELTDRSDRPRSWTRASTRACGSTSCRSWHHLRNPSTRRRRNDNGQRASQTRHPQSPRSALNGRSRSTLRRLERPQNVPPACVDPLGSPLPNGSSASPGASRSAARRARPLPTGSDCLNRNEPATIRCASLALSTVADAARGVVRTRLPH